MFNKWLLEVLSLKDMGKNETMNLLEGHGKEGDNEFTLTD